MGDIVSLAMLSTFFGLIIIKTKQSKNKHKIDEIDPDFIEITIFMLIRYEIICG